MTFAYSEQVWKALSLLQVASLWLALDDVTIENGAMDMFPFSTMPQVWLGIFHGDCDYDLMVYRFLEQLFQLNHGF